MSKNIGLPNHRMVTLPIAKKENKIILELHIISSDFVDWCFFLLRISLNNYSSLEGLISC